MDDMTNQEKALVVLEDRATGGDRWFHLVMMLSAITGYSPEECLDRIKAMANGEVDEHA